MITKELIERINFLAKKKREEGLTQEEAAEQQRLRRIYLDGIRAQVKDQLDRIKIVDEDEICKHHDKNCCCTHH